MSRWTLLCSESYQWQRWLVGLPYVTLLHVQEPDVLLEPPVNCDAHLHARGSCCFLRGPALYLL
jgi:hypothetical protein